IPFVQSGVLVEPLVALQPDQIRAMDGGERLADFRLADAGLTFQEERPLEEIHKPQRDAEIAVGDVADGGEAIGDVVAVQCHGAPGAALSRLPQVVPQTPPLPACGERWTCERSASEAKQVG